MSFDLGQLFQGPVRDLVLGQVTKQLGLSNESAGGLLNKGLSSVLGGMVQQSGSKEGASALFNLIKNTGFNVNPVDLLTGKADSSQLGGLLETGKKLLPSLFGNRADAVTSYLANSTGVSADKAQSFLGLIAPTVFSFFKNKIAGGLTAGGFASLLGEQAKAAASHLDTNALGALGFAGNSFNDALGSVSKIGGLLGAGVAGAAAAGTKATAAAQSVAGHATATAGKSGLWKWLTAGAVLLAALLGFKSCSNNTTETTAPATPTPAATPAPATTPAAPAAPVAEEAKTTDGLGNLSWLKTDTDFTLSGLVQNDELKTKITDAFSGLAGGLPVVNNLVVDAKAGKFSFDNFAGLANVFKSFPAVSGSFADKAFELVGKVGSDAEKSSLVDQVKGVLGSLFSVNADKVTVEAPATPATEPAQAAPAAEEPEAEVIADMSLEKLDLNIVFDTGSSEIKQRYNRRLNAFAHYLVENKRAGEIAGYTDNVGDAAANQKLSEERANSVRNYLIAQGVPADQLVAVGYGQENPIADNGTDEGRAQNRRIEFNVQKAQ
ncbi:OmpA family protein [Pelistega suis]|uniref:OmpA family protein n=1 Tax=Pelistega suis TaxID=1631957 RepID=A0A849P3K5_9BURK|nr:OmpA family protein [Pelistega suis]NOL50934.1 OmpA family protein [Pelistega suis]